MFKNVDEIKKAVDEGKKVYWKPGYIVEKYSNRYFIRFIPNNNMVGLTHKDGKTMDYDIEDFYMED